mgnify:CR=1 FL=1
MFCENCGAELNENVKFCENCGTKVERKNKSFVTDNNTFSNSINSAGLSQKDLQNMDEVVSIGMEFESKDDFLKAFIQGSKIISFKRYMHFYKCFLHFSYKENNIIRWNTAAFFFGTLYFFYRKCYITGSIALIASIIFSFFSPLLSFLLNVAYGLFADFIIYSRYTKLMKKTENLSSKKEKINYMEKEGGTSKLWILVLIVLLFVIDPLISKIYISSISLSM